MTKRQSCAILFLAVSGWCFASPPLEMKLLVLAANGDEPSYSAIRSYLDHLGTPYETVLTGKGQNLPALDDGATGHYQGIILVTGNLGVCDPDCHSTLSASDWDRLSAYCAAYSVRTLSYYTYPEARYGLHYRDGFLAVSQSPATASFTPDALPLFPYLRQNRDVPVAGAFVYLADTVAADGETTTPVLRIGDATVGAVHVAADGRETLALTMDNAPTLRHSLLLNYGLISWVTKAVFLGLRQTYLSPQIDDLFLANNLFTLTGGSCTPTQFILSAASPPSPDCPRLRITGADLSNIRNWQASWDAQPQTRAFRLTLAYNAAGAKPDSGDDLTDEALRSSGDFFWVNHTFDHKNLDCYSMGAAGDCHPAAYDESLFEVQRNFLTSQQIGIPADPISLITPAISGLTNGSFLRAAADAGVRYLVSDMSIQAELPAAPNTGVLSPLTRDIVFVPRMATNIFYNSVAPAEGASGSETDEYNYFFGPAGIVRVGGPGGPPFFPATQSYDQLIDREGEALVNLMLRYEMYPCMFHQSNVFSYQGSNSLLSDVLDRALQKFTALSTLPVLSLEQGSIGRLLEERMTWLASGARATLNPGVSITITTGVDTTVPITGACAANCSAYGTENQSRVPVPAGATVTVPLR